MSKKNNDSDVELPVQFSRDLKIEETSQGIRIHVHVYGTNSTRVIQEAFDMYKDAINKTDTSNPPILRAPMEIKEVKKKEVVGVK